MSKSSQKRRLHAKRRRELDKLRGVALLDSSSPTPGFDRTRTLEQSPNPLNTAHLKNYGRNRPTGAREEADSTVEAKMSKPVVLPTTKIEADFSKPVVLPMAFGGGSRKNVEFVLPRALGKAEIYIFDKHAKAQINEELPTIGEGDEGNVNDEEVKRSKANESIDDILFPKRKRKLEGSFDAVHQEEKKETKENETLGSAQPAKKKRKRGSSVDIKGKDRPGLSLVPVSSTALILKEDKNSKKERKSDASIGKHRAGSELVEGGKLSGLTVNEAVKDKHGLRPRANSTDGELNLPQRGLCDERMVLQAHKWSDEQNYVHQMMPKGFVNLGNTCFLNSILQCLAYLPPFCQSLIAISEAKQKNGIDQKPTQGQKITSALCSLFQKVHGFNINTDFEGALTPRAIVKALPSIGSCGSRNGYKFSPGRQEDAHEFLVHLLDAMHDGELRAAGINQHVSGWRDRLPVTRLDETTFIHRIFGGYFRSQVRCRKCGYRSNTYDPFLDLSLEVSQKSSNGVLYALAEFTKKETLDSENQWRCSGCKKYTCATKHLTVFRPPLSLCVQLKRFTFDSGFGGGGLAFHGSKGFKNGKNGKFNHRGGSKITKPIEFPAELDLPLSDGRSCAYALTGVVIHVGGSASSGHYTAYVKKPGRKGRNQWYLADDSFVEPVSERTVLKNSSAYVLFYCRKEVKLEFPAPPPRCMSTEAALEFGRARARARADSATQDESGKKRLLCNGADERETKEVIGALKSIPNDAPAKDGAVKRVKTNIHPLASPQPATLQPSKGEAMDISTPATSTVRWTIKSSASFPDESMRTSQVLGKDLLRRLSEVNHDKQRRSLQLAKAERNCVKSSSPSSSAESSSDDDEGAVKPKKTGHDSDDSSSDDSTNGSDADNTKNALQNVAKPRKGSGSDSTSDSDSSDLEEETKKGKRGIFRNLSGSHDKPLSAGKDSEDIESSSGEDSDNDSTSSSDEGSSQGSRTKGAQNAQKTRANTNDIEARQTNVTRKEDKQKESNRTRVFLGGSDSRGKVKIMLGPRKKRSWKSKASTSGAKGAAFELLGNTGVSRWDEDDHEQGSDPKQKPSNAGRSNIVGSMEKQERSRKRKMHLDRWDSLLDQGKVRNLNYGVA